MPRIFKEMGFNSSSVLSASEYVRYVDSKNKAFIPEKVAPIIKRAESHLTKELPILPASVYLDYPRNGNRSRYESIHFARRSMALDLAIAESVEKQGRFADKLMDVVWAIMEESTWIIPAHLYNSPSHAHYGLGPVYNSDRIHGIDLFSASTSGALSTVYMLCKDTLDGITPLICEKMEYELIDRTIKPFINCVFWWTGERGNSVNNWNPWIISNVLHTLSVVNVDMYTRKLVVQKCLDSLDNFTAHYASDGGCDEGPSYWGAAGASYFDCLELLYDLSGGKINVYSHPLVKAMMEYIVKFNINGRRFINFADCGPSCHHDGIMIRRMGEKCGSAALSAFGDTMAVLSDGGVSWSHVYRGLRNLIVPTPTSASSNAETKVWFPDLKVMTARESADSAKGMFVAMKGGHNGEQHNHNDVGNVVVYYNGNPVIVDTGVGTYTKQTFSNRRYELWFMQSSYHNLPDISGLGQKEGRRYASSDEVYDAETGGVKMEIGGAYLPESGVKSYTRETVLKDGTVYITDTMSLDGERDVDFHFMCAQKPEITSAGKIALAEGRVMTYDTDLEAEVEEFPANDGGIQRNWNSEVMWRIHFRKKMESGSYTFIVE